MNTHTPNPLRAWLRDYSREATTLWLENRRSPLAWTLFLKPDAVRVTRHVRQSVLGSEAKEAAAEEAWRLREWYRDGLTLKAVAATVIALIGISVMNLHEGSDNWAVSTLAFVGIVCGVLSTHAAFTGNAILGSLRRPEDALRWLKKRSRRSTADVNNPPERPDGRGEDDVPCLDAAAILTAPNRLLTCSVAALLLSLLVHQGIMTSYHDAEVQALCLFVACVVLVLGETILPLYHKWIHLRAQEPMLQIDSKTQHPDGREGPRSDSAASSQLDGLMSGADMTLVQAVEASVRAQEQSLAAQQALLRLLRAQADKGASLPVMHAEADLLRLGLV